MAESSLTPSRTGFRGERFLSVLLLLFLWGTAILLVWQRKPNHASMGLELTAVLLLTLLTRLLGQVPLSLFSCLLLGPLLTIESLCLYYYIAHKATLALLLLLDVGLLLLVQTGHLRRYFMGMSATGLAAGFLLLTYNLLSNRLMPAYYTLGRRLQLNPFHKSLLMAAAGLVFLLLYILGLKILSRLFSRWHEKTRILSQQFYELEPFILMLVVLTIILWYVLEYFFFLTTAQGVLPTLMVTIPFFFFFMDAAYLCLLIKAVSIREKMRVSENDKNLLSAYNTELENTLDSLHEIRHDAKNLLLTMGSFVEQSGNAQMKEFYQKNIVPFMQDALIRNELQAKLKILRDDCLKSFLYYKILEKNEKGIPVLLTLTSPMCLEIGQGDLIRLLGILIDNAAEEAVQAGGAISLDIREDAQELRIRVANQVRPAIRARGVVPGTTDKGLGRGQGLLIAEKIVSRYHNLLLNSYFTEDGFVQCLLLVKTP